MCCIKVEGRERRESERESEGFGKDMSPCQQNLTYPPEKEGLSVHYDLSWTVAVSVLGPFVCFVCWCSVGCDVVV